MFSKKGVLLILDGLGDRPITALNSLTPLEAAHTPVMDQLTANGLCGLVTHLAPGIPVGTQTGSGLLLGLAPADVGLLSRGLVQAVGVGLDLKPGDIAMRSNFATLDWGPTGAAIIDRRAGRISESTAALADAVNSIHISDDIRIQVKSSTQHRAAIVIQGEGLSDAITDTDPGSGEAALGLQTCQALDTQNGAALRTADFVNTFLRLSHEILKVHPVNKERERQGLLPANGFVTRGAGRVKALRNIIRYLDIKTAVISGEGTLKGLARLFGFDYIFRPAFTATTKTDLNGKIEATLEALETADLAILHIKGPDLCAHDQNPIAKRDFIEAIDAALAPILSVDAIIGITADHATDSTTGRHTGDPVPSLISGTLVRKDAVSHFGESYCMQGGLGQLSPTSFLCTMLDQMNKMHNFRSHEHEYFKE